VYAGGLVDLMTLFRSLFLAGLVLFFAAQQALCACMPPAGMAGPADVVTADEMPMGHACDETKAPEHDESTCPHCQSGKAPLFQTAQWAPTPVILAATAPAVFQLEDARQLAPSDTGPSTRQVYEAHGPPRRTPVQLKTRFLN